MTHVLIRFMLKEYNTYRYASGSNEQRHQLSCSADLLKAPIEFLHEERN